MIYANYRRIRGRSCVYGEKLTTLRMVDTPVYPNSPLGLSGRPSRNTPCKSGIPAETPCISDSFQTGEDLVQVSSHFRHFMHVSI
jgi:hypothetical protein